MPFVPVFVLGAVLSLSAAACSRAAAASFVPSLRLQLSARSSDREDSSVRRQVPWDASVIAWLRFEPKIAASGIPLRAEFDPELAAIPCELEDTTCLEEFAEGERESAGVLGELE